MNETKELKVEDIRKSAEEQACAVRKALDYITGFLDGPMCGKCFPCAMGSYEMKVRLTRLTQGTGSKEDIEALKRIADSMAAASMCKKGKDSAGFIAAWAGSAEVFEAHTQGRCPEKSCIKLISFRVVPSKCTMCGNCLEACSYHAIIGEKRKPYMGGYTPFEIRQKKCTRCGKCVGACPDGAIEAGDRA